MSIPDRLGGTPAGIDLAWRGVSFIYPKVLQVSNGVRSLLRPGIAAVASDDDSSFGASIAVVGPANGITATESAADLA